MSGAAIFAGVRPSPRKVTSVSLKSMPTSPAGANPTTNTPGGKAAVRAGTLGSTARSSKLGAKKAAASINYEEAERKARVEEDHIKQLNHRIERDSDTPNHHVTLAGKSTAPGPVAVTSPVRPSSVADSESPIGKYDAGQDPQRLGIGFQRLGLGPASTTSDSPSYRTAKLDDAPTTARERFGNQKAISSEMFFERGAYDPATVSEAKAKLAQFEGATSISSNQYFGQEGEEGSGLSGSFTGNESLSALEANTRDALNRVMTKEEVQNALESVRAGALKVSDNNNNCSLPCQ